jgi:hypothetical protein
MSQGRNNHSCQHEADEHDHHHHHHDHDHDHDHDEEGVMGEERSLYNTIDMEHVVCLNQQTEASSEYTIATRMADILRPWHDRWLPEPTLESDCDAQLIINIPFTASVKIKSIIVYSGHGEHAPSEMKA